MSQNVCSSSRLSGWMNLGVRLTGKLCTTKGYFLSKEIIIEFHAGKDAGRKYLLIIPRYIPSLKQLLPTAGLINTVSEIWISITADLRAVSQSESLIISQKNTDVGWNAPLSVAHLILWDCNLNKTFLICLILIALMSINCFVSLDYMWYSFLCWGKCYEWWWFEF